MAINFGISFGDCVAGAKLLKDVTEALGSSRKAEKEYDSLMLIIESLEPLLLEAQELQIEKGREAEIKPYKKVATNIKNLVESFVDRIAKFDRTMTAGSSSWVERVGIACRKLEWTFLKPLVQDFISDLNTQVNILNAMSGQIRLKIAIKPPSTQADSLLFQPFKCANRRVTQQESRYSSTSPNLPLRPFNGEISTPLATKLVAEEREVIPDFCAYELGASYAESFGFLSSPGGDLPWSKQESIHESGQLVCNYFLSNRLEIPRRKNCRLPIKDPADGSKKIFLQQTGTANLSALNHDPAPCFTIPGPKSRRVTIKDPVDGSTKLLDHDIKCVKKQAINTETRKASPLFARPTGTKVVVKDPLNMSILDLVSKP